MPLILLSPGDLALAAALVLALAALSLPLRLGLARMLLVGALRTAVQLYLVGLVLRALFSHVHLGWLALAALFMLLVAGREVAARQSRRFTAGGSYAVGVLAMSVSSFTVLMLALGVLISPAPWYAPQYSIPLLGMLLGNTMTGVAISVDRVVHSAVEGREAIEQRLALGEDWRTATAEIRRDSLRTGLIPIVNAMAAAGIVSLPGMMTGQILAGTAPEEAVKYQILIMFLIAAATGFGSLIAVWLANRRLFDQRERLRLDRLTSR